MKISKNLNQEKNSKQKAKKISPGVSFLIVGTLVIMAFFRGSISHVLLITLFAGWGIFTLIKYNQEQKPKYSKSTPVPDIYRVMKLEDARNCIVDVGDYRGKTMQQVANEKLSSVEWYVRSYNGPNNILRAAAKIVLEVTRAEQEAS